VTEPIVFISHSLVRDGKLNGLRAFIASGAPMLQDLKPLTLAFLPYLSEDGRELAIVHLFADADAFDAHLEGVAERSGAADEFIEAIRYEIYGRPSDKALAMMRGAAERARVPLRLDPDYLSGFLRAG
jgi:hypothetical protein